MRKLLFILVGFLILSGCGVVYNAVEIPPVKKFIGVAFCEPDDHNKDEKIQWSEVLNIGSSMPDKYGNYYVVFHPEKLEAQTFTLLLEWVDKDGRPHRSFLIKDKKHPIIENSSLVCKIRNLKPGINRVIYIVDGIEYLTADLVIKEDTSQNYFIDRKGR